MELLIHQQMFLDLAGSLLSPHNEVHSGAVCVSIPVRREA